MASAEKDTSSESQASGLKSRDSNDQSRDLASTGPETVADREVTKNDVMVSIFEYFLPFQRFMSLQHHLWIFPSKVSLFHIFVYFHTITPALYACFIFIIMIIWRCLHTISLAVHYACFIFSGSMYMHVLFSYDNIGSK